jgi:hypothetical protein
MKRKDRLELERITSLQIAEMNSNARLVQEEKPAYERQDKVAMYLVGEHQNGRLTDVQMLELALLLNISLTRKVGVQVDVRFTLELDLPYSVAKEDELAEMEFSAYTVHPSKTLSSVITDVSNIKL